MTINQIKGEKMIKVAIVDDHPLLRDGIKNVFERNDEDISVTIQASNADELLDQLEDELPNIVILDIGLPKKSGLDLLKEIKEKYDGLPVLILSMHPEERFAIRSIKAGAQGYLNKRVLSEKLMEAVDQIVNKGKKYISETLAEQLAMEVNGDGNNELPHNKLSDREFQVMCMIASGKRVKEIAEELSLSARTIHTYRSRLMEKMDLGSNVALTRYALSHHLIEKP